MGHGGLHGWTWEGVASVTLQKTVINTEFLGNQVQENSLCGSVSMKSRGFNSVVPDTAKPTTLDLCRAECASAWLVQKMRSDRLSWVWIWMRPCGKPGFLYKVLSLSMLLCRTQQRAWDGSWSVLALEKEALHLRSVGMETGHTGERSLCFLGENTLFMEGALKTSSAELAEL